MKTIMRTLRLTATLLLAAAVAAPAFAAVPWFSDVPDIHPNYADISDARARKWIQGYEDGKFRPGVVITPEQAARVFEKAFGDDLTRAEFDSVLRGGAQRLKERGRGDDDRVSLQGYVDESFRTDAVIAPEQAASVIRRAFGDDLTRAEFASVLMGGKQRLYDWEKEEANWASRMSSGHPTTTAVRAPRSAPAVPAAAPTPAAPAATTSAPEKTAPAAPSTTKDPAPPPPAAPPPTPPATTTTTTTTTTAPFVYDYPLESEMLRWKGKGERKFTASKGTRGTQQMMRDAITLLEAGEEAGVRLLAKTPRTSSRWTYVDGTLRNLRTRMKQMSDVLALENAPVPARPAGLEGATTPLAIYAAISGGGNTFWNGGGSANLTRSQQLKFAWYAYHTAVQVKGNGEYTDAGARYHLTNLLRQEVGYPFFPR